MIVRCPFSKYRATWKDLIVSTSNPSSQYSQVMCANDTWSDALLVKKYPLQANNGPTSARVS
eukprot:5603522-Amphidinium_carterae.1